MLNEFTGNRRTMRVCNTSEAIKGTPCNGCDFLEVLTKRKWNPRFICFEDVERFYCDRRGRFVEPRVIVECDDRRDGR